MKGERRREEGEEEEEERWGGRGREKKENRERERGGEKNVKRRRAWRNVLTRNRTGVVAATFFRCAGLGKALARLPIPHSSKRGSITYRWLTLAADRAVCIWQQAYGPERARRLESARAPICPLSCQTVIGVCECVCRSVCAVSSRVLCSVHCVCTDGARYMLNYSETQLTRRQ